MRRSTLFLAVLGLALAPSAGANPDCYYNAPRIQHVVMDDDRIRIVGECLVEPYNPIPKVSLGAHEELDLLSAEEREVVVAAPALKAGEFVLVLHRGYHNDRFPLSVSQSSFQP